MAIVNCSVVNRTSNKTVLPWSIVSAGESGITVQQFYDEKIVTQFSVSDEMDLESAFLGKSKDSLDKIELSISLDRAIQLFGPFLRYHTCDRIQQVPPVRDAFSVLMLNQRQLSLPSLPASLAVRTKKDQLYNDFLGVLREENAHVEAAVLALQVDKKGEVRSITSDRGRVFYLWSSTARFGTAWATR